MTLVAWRQLVTSPPCFGESALRLQIRAIWDVGAAGLLIWWTFSISGGATLRRHRILPVR
jgi:hypothetical protein